jgi:hypothetical protein
MRGGPAAAMGVAPGGILGFFNFNPAYIAQHDYKNKDVLGYVGWVGLDEGWGHDTR